MDSVIERIIAADEKARQTVNDAKKARDTANIIIDEKKAALEKEYADKTSAVVSRYRCELDISARMSEAEFEAKYNSCCRVFETAGKEIIDADNIVALIKKFFT